MVEDGRETGGDRQAGGLSEEPKATDKPETPGRDAAESSKKSPEEIEEIGGPKGPEPTRFGDWEKGGRCSDF